MIMILQEEFELLVREKMNTCILYQDQGGKP